MRCRENSDFCSTACAGSEEAGTYTLCLQGSYLTVLIVQVGVVSPYAVVELNAKRPAVAPAAQTSTGAQSKCVHGKSLVTGDRVSCERNALPRREAPPPPLRMNSYAYSSDHRSTSQGKCMIADSAADRLRSRGNVGLKKGKGPKKPPRTSSTYLEDEKAFVLDKKDLEHTVPSDCSSEARGSRVSRHLASLMADTVQRVYAKFLEKVIRQDPLWKISWQHLSVLSPNRVVYKRVQMSLQVCFYSMQTTIVCYILH